METAKCKLRQKSKFVRLLSKYRSVTHSSDVQDGWVVNLSSNPLTGFETEVLRKGLNFAPSPSSIPVSRIIASVERRLSMIPKDEATLAWKCIACVLSRAKVPPSNLPPHLRSALKYLRRRDDILILPADKGRATFVLNKAEYDEKVLVMLSDARTYKKLDRDPALSMERTLLLRLKKKGSIPVDLYNDYDRLVD